MFDWPHRPDGWAALSVTHCDGSTFHGWWRRDDAFVLTIASRQPSPPPVWLDGGGLLSGAVPVHSWLTQLLVQPPDAPEGPVRPSGRPE